MLTRRPLIPHVEVRAWDLGTEPRAPRPQGKGDQCSARSVSPQLHSQSRSRASASPARPALIRADRRVPGHRRRRPGHRCNADPGAGRAESSGAQGPIGAAQPTTFTTDTRTRWIAVHGNTPVSGLRHRSRRRPGDRRLPAPWHTPLATLVATPASSVTDLSARTRPAGRLSCSARPPRRSTRPRTRSRSTSTSATGAAPPMLGQPVHQTFTYDANTVFLKWRHGVPIGVDQPSSSPETRSRCASSARPGTRRSRRCSQRRSGASSWASPCASRCVTARSCPAPDRPPAGPPLPAPSSRGACRASPPHGAGREAGPVALRRVASDAWSVSGHPGA